MIRPHYAPPPKHAEANAIVCDCVSRLIWGKAGEFDPALSSTMAVLDGRDMIAGVVFHGYHPDAGVIELSSAARSPRWLQPHVIRAMFHLPFDLLDCQMIVLRVSERNETMCSIARRFGFDGVRIPRLRGRDEDEMVFTLTDEQWRAHRLYKSGLAKYH